MIQMTIHFVDTTIPGLSGRDLRTKFVGIRSGGGALKDLQIRRSLSSLSRRTLQDIGLDRFSA